MQKFAHEMFAEIENLRHLASTKFGKDLPLNEDTLGLAEATVQRTPCIFSEDGKRKIDVVESLLKTLLAKRADLLNETSQHHARLLALCCEAAGDEGVERTPALLGEKEFGKSQHLVATERKWIYVKFSTTNNKTVVQKIVMR